MLLPTLARAQQPVVCGLATPCATAGKQDTLQTAIDNINLNLAAGVAANTPNSYISTGAGDAEDEQQIKATPGVLAGISAFNVHATADAWVKCTNLTAANTTPGSSAIFYRLFVPSLAHGGGAVDRNIERTFSVALTCYIVKGAADNAEDEVGANDVVWNIDYR